MVLFPLFDPENPLPERSRRVATQLVEAALSDLAQLEKLDDSLAPENPLQFDRKTATLLRNAYEQWARDTESLIERIDRFEHRSGLVAETESLRRAYGKTRARLSISVDDMEQSLRALAEGKLVPMEEVRRELRLRVH
jgi:hypothetical protein